MMLTRNRSRRDNVTNDENNNCPRKPLAKNVHHKARSVLGTLRTRGRQQNQNKSEDSDLEFTRACKEAVFSGYSHLPPAVRSDFTTYYNKKALLRKRLLQQHPEYAQIFELNYGHMHKDASNFADSIFDYLQHAEYLTYYLPTDFLSVCPDVTPRMRYILVNWIVNVHRSFNMASNILFHAISLMDRYIYKVGPRVDRHNFQLLGVTALYSASKFEEVFPPAVNEYSNLLDGLITTNDILEFEQKLLVEMQFDVNAPTPTVFLKRLSQILELDTTVYYLSRYFSELTLQEYELSGLTGNCVAAISVCLARAVMSDKPELQESWDDRIGFFSGFCLDDLREPIKFLARAAYRQHEPSRYRAVLQKYRGDSKYQCVGSLPQLTSRTMKHLCGLF